MAKFKTKLSQGLTEDHFQLHEEIMDESSLFKLHVLCDEVMNRNPKAKHDGGFKVRSFSLKCDFSCLPWTSHYSLTVWWCDSTNQKCKICGGGLDAGSL